MRALMYGLKYGRVYSYSSNHRNSFFFKHNIGYQDKKQIDISTFTSQNGPAGSALLRAAPPPASVGFPASAASLSHPSGRAGSIAAGAAVAASSLSASRAASLAASLPSTPSVVAERRPPSLRGVLSNRLRHASPHPVRALLAEVLLWPLGGHLPARGFFLLLLGSLLVYLGLESSRG